MFLISSYQIFSGTTFYFLKMYFLCTLELLRDKNGWFKNLTRTINLEITNNIVLSIDGNIKKIK